MQRAKFLIGLAAVWSLSFLATAAQATQTATRLRAHMTPAEERIRTALDEPTSIEFIETPLETAVAYLQKLHGIPIQLHRGPLEAIRIGPAVTITYQLQQVTLRSALSLMLEEMNLTWVIRDDVLLITTIAYAQQNPLVHVYDVSGLVGAGETADELVQAVHQAVTMAPPANRLIADLHSAPDIHVPTRILAYRRMLIVRAGQSQHDKIEELLSVLGRGFQAEPEPAPALGQPQPGLFQPGP